MIREFGRNFTLTWMIALHGMRSQTICRNIAKGKPTTDRGRSDRVLVGNPRAVMNSTVSDTKRPTPHQAAIRIRKAKHGDAAAIKSLLYESFLEYERAYTPEAFHITTPEKREIESRIKHWKVWVALHANVIVGTVSAHPEGQTLHIRSMAVRPSMRGRGIGKLLLQRVEKFASANAYKRLVLNTTPFLASAIRLYERFGFRATGSERDWFGTTIRLMAKQVIQTD
jgi:N-acetylglutamate synthase-like GNAT family acetyltransferase